MPHDATPRDEGDGERNSQRWALPAVLAAVFVAAIAAVAVITGAFIIALPAMAVLALAYGLSHSPNRRRRHWIAPPARHPQRATIFDEWPPRRRSRGGPAPPP